jgi:hypothetical protein
MSYITARGEIQHRDRPGFDKPPARFIVGDTVKPLAGLTRAGQPGRVIWAMGNQAVLRFSDGKRLHYWTHEIERVGGE